MRPTLYQLLLFALYNACIWMKGCWKHTFPSKKYSQIDVDHVAYCKLTILVKFIVLFAVEMQTINEILMVQQGRIAGVFFV